MLTMTTVILAERVYNFVARAARVSREDRTKLRFRFGHKSFYRFGIRSCLATSHNMPPLCSLGFQATRAATWVHFIHPLFYIVRWQIAKYF